jgi:hypothetical protein
MVVEILVVYCKLLRLGMTWLFHVVTSKFITDDSRNFLAGTKPQLNIDFPTTLLLSKS